MPRPSKHHDMVLNWHYSNLNGTWASHFHSCATLAFHCTAGVVCGNYGLRSAQILRWPHLIRRTPEPERWNMSLSWTTNPVFASTYSYLVCHSGSNTSIEQKKKGEPFLGTGSRRLGWVASLWTILPLLATGRRGHETLLHDTSWHIHSVYANLLRLLSPTVMQWKILEDNQIIIIQGRLLPSHADVLHHHSTWWSPIREPRFASNQ